MIPQIDIGIGDVVYWLHGSDGHGTHVVRGKVWRMRLEIEEDYGVDHYNSWFSIRDKSMTYYNEIGFYELTENGDCCRTWSECEQRWGKCILDEDSIEV